VNKWQIDEVAAQEMLAACRRALQALDEAATIAAGVSDEVTRREIKRGIGSTIAELDLEVIEHLWSAVPHLRPSDMPSMSSGDDCERPGD